MADASPSSPRAEELLRAYLADLAAGRARDFEALCSEHRELERDLRVLVRGAEVARQLAASPAAQAVVETGISLPASAQESEVHARLLEQLRADGPRGTRYETRGEIARGGMGAILEVHDPALRRTLAMKVVLGRGELTASGHAAVEPKLLDRFLEEAQITGQLEHPGIVPVHELGLDANAHVYFTMRLVKGEELGSVFGHVRAGRDGWTQIRALHVLLRVCEAMSYAHSKGVVHRDLKPQNVMVGRFGDVYVMDWGLARVLGRTDRHDLRLRPSGPASQVGTTRRDEHESATGSPLVTMDGDVIGTPSYMPPEQARGELEALGPHSDVYALGAMLYELVGGEAPYVPKGARVSAHTVLAALLAGPPRPLQALAPEAPAELVAISAKAMARAVGGRYATTAALADDLRAFLEGRVVHAYESGALAEARKWVSRNRLLAAALGAAVLAIGGGAVAFAYKAHEATLARDSLATTNEELRSTNLALEEAQREATQKADDVLSLSAQKDLDDLVAQAETLWPPDPVRGPAYEDWLRRADELVAGRPAVAEIRVKRRPGLAEHRTKLAEVRRRARPASADGGAVEYDDPEDAWWDRQLVRLIADLEALHDPATGLRADVVAAPFGWGIARRQTFAHTIQERSVDGAEARERWADARAAIRAEPRYGGLELAPQVGLLPLGADPFSGLWEFAHLQTGEPARRGPDGQLERSEATGLVLVLIPGGVFWMGSQRDDPVGRNFEPRALANEGPVHEVELGAYFLSKYEMTVAQWQRIAAENPSFYGPARYPSNWNREGRPWSPLHPVEQVSRTECVTMMERTGLALPSEAQWEHACRAGTGTPYSSGADPASLATAGNISDAYAKAHEGEFGAWHEWDDGNTCHAEVGSYDPNAFGMHDMHGNVQEWCLDGSLPYPQERVRDPVLPWEESNRILRGGDFHSRSDQARSSYRTIVPPELKSGTVGLRPARAVRP